MVQVFNRVSSFTHQILSRFFYAVGKNAAAYPILFIILGLVVTSLPGLGLLKIQSASVDTIGYIGRVQAFKDEMGFINAFGKSREDIRQETSVAMILSQKDLLQLDVLDALWGLHKTILYNVTSSLGDTYQDICTKTAGQCVSASFFDGLQTAGISSISKVPSSNVLKHILSSDQFLTEQDKLLLNSVLGKQEYDESGDQTGQDCDCCWCMPYGQLLFRVPATPHAFACALLSAHAMRLIYIADVEKGADRLSAWELELALLLTDKDFLKTLAQTDPVWNKIDEVHVGAQGAAVYELDQLVQQETKVAIGTITVIIVFLAIVLGSKPPIKSRIGLSLTAGITVVFALVFALGICGFVSVPFTTISPLAGFILLGIGVDDMIIIVDSVDQQDKRLSIEEQIGLGYKAAGHSITVTTLTTFVAFLLGSLIDQPMISYFNTLSAIGVVGVFLLQATFFAGCLALDQKRMINNKIDVFCCYQGGLSNSSMGQDQQEQQQQNASLNDPHAVKQQGLAQMYVSNQPLQSKQSLSKQKSSGGVQKSGDSCFLPIPPPASRSKITELIDRKGYVKQALNWFGLNVLKFRAFRFLIIAIFLGMSGFGVVGLLKIKSGLNLQELYPNDSFTYAFIDASRKNFYASQTQAYIYIDGEVNYADQSVQAGLKSLLDELLSKEYFSPPTTNWMDDYQQFLQKRKIKLRDQHDYYTNLVEFLDAEYFYVKSKNGQFQGKMAIDPAIASKSLRVSHESQQYNNVTIQASYFSMYLAIPELDITYENLKETREILDRHSKQIGAQVRMYNHDITSIETVVNLRPVMLQSITYASLGVLSCTMLFVPPQVAILIFLVVVMIDLDLFGMLYLWGLSIDPISFICISMALGLSIDYVVHIVVSYQGQPEAIKHDQPARMAATYSEIGSSVLFGATSTFLGTLLLALSKSASFRNFFKIMFSVCLFGTLHGLILVPALLVEIYTIIYMFKKRP